MHIFCARFGYMQNVIQVTVPQKIKTTAYQQNLRFFLGMVSDITSKVLFASIRICRI